MTFDITLFERRSVSTCALALLGLAAFTQPLRAAQQLQPPPAWMMRGYQTALSDQKAFRAIVRSDLAKPLSQWLTPGPNSSELLSKLLQLLQSPSRDLRDSAEHAIRSIRWGDFSAVVGEAIATQVTNPAIRVKKNLIRLLGQFKPKDITLSSKLLELAVGNPALRASVAEALGSLGALNASKEVIDMLIESLSDPDSDVQDASTRALTRLKVQTRTEEIIKASSQILKFGDNRVPILELLISLPYDDELSGIAEDLYALVATQDPDVVALARPLLRRALIGGTPRKLIQQYTGELNSSDPDLQLRAIRAMREAPPGYRNEAAIEALLRIASEHQTNTIEAIATLGQTRPGDHLEAVESALLSRLSEPDYAKAAAIALSNLSNLKYQDKLADTLALMMEQDETRPAAALAYSRITDSSNVVVLAKALARIHREGDDLDDAEERVAKSIFDRSIDQAARNLTAEDIVQVLARLLGREPRGTRYALKRLVAAIDLGGQKSSTVAQLMLLLSSSGQSTRLGALYTLDALEVSVDQPDVFEMLRPFVMDKSTDARVAAITLLSRTTVPSHADQIAGTMLKMISERANISRDERRAVSQMLARIPLTNTRAAVSFLSSQLKETASPDVLWALGAIGDPNYSDVVLPRILPVLAGAESADSVAALAALSKNGPAGVALTIAGLQRIHSEGESMIEITRGVLHLMNGSDARAEQSETLLAWLGYPMEPPITTIRDNPEEAARLFRLFEKHWPELEKSPSLRREAEERIMQIVYGACNPTVDARDLRQILTTLSRWVANVPTLGPVQQCWNSTQREALDKLLGRLDSSGSGYSRALSDHLAKEKLAPVGQWFTWTAAAWAAFWLTFLLLFPRSKFVQAMFFWNPKVRGVMSLWFVPLLLLVLPPLRRRLLRPFLGSLTAAARLNEFVTFGFFGEGPVAVPPQQRLPVSDAAAQMRGLTVISGEAGLGKTSMLRFIVSRSRKPFAFILARDCAAGVDVAIARLMNDVQDTAFVKSMVYSGALGVIVDGLNEVSADTREKISTFAQEMSNGDVFIGTQPIEWVPPSNAKQVTLLPLSRAEATRFLITRPVGQDPGQSCHGPDFDQAVNRFLHHSIEKAPTEEDRHAAELMLSNPFDLAFAADLLARGLMPPATALIDEAFKLADLGAPDDLGYRSVIGQPFPLVTFGKHAVTMRLEDRNWLKEDEFPAEVSCLIDWKLLVRRSVRGPGGSTISRLQFRHDRVWDFFIAAAFNSDPELWALHISDIRFRGAYLRIAETWPDAASTIVRDELVKHAAQFGDHSTSDEFIRRLESRRRAIGAPAAERAVA